MFNEIMRLQNNPPGGHGGLGIISHAINRTAQRYGQADGYGLFNMSLLHTQRRVQSFPEHQTPVDWGGFMQHLDFIDVPPDAPGADYYHYLGQMIEVNLYGQPRPVDTWMFTGFSDQNRFDPARFVPAIKFSVPSVTGELYPDCTSPEILAQMQVLGQGGFRLSQKLGLIGCGAGKMNADSFRSVYGDGAKRQRLLDNLIRLGISDTQGNIEHSKVFDIFSPEDLTLDEEFVNERGPVRQVIIESQKSIADLFIGHEGHTALFNFNLYLWFKRLHNGDHTEAMRDTQDLCASTDHAPQAGTVARTRGENFRQHYSEEDDRDWGSFGWDPGKPTNAKAAAEKLSRHSGVVSPLHLEVVKAEMADLQNGVQESIALAPTREVVDGLKIFTDTIDMDDWLGLGTKAVLDKHFPEWRQNPQMLGTDRLINSALRNSVFLGDLAEAFDAQDNFFFQLLQKFGRRFGTEIPDDAIIIASLRRASEYKIKLLTEFLNKRDMINSIAGRENRPIIYLLGGIAHHKDGNAKNALKDLLVFLFGINGEKGKLSGEFLLNHDYDKAAWLFQGLAKRGCWIGATNPTDSRSQGTEAFGPSYIKSSVNGVWILGPDDGGAGCLKGLPAVHTYGPTMVEGEQSYYRHFWNSREAVENSRRWLGAGFIKGLGIMAHNIATDLDYYEQGEGALAPGLLRKVPTMFKVIAGYNGRVLLDSYLNCIPPKN
ncbi:MAG: hypothetical protein NTZ10_02540 [Candidatus Saganbacteria bacterium]|nr:hypothetical protein [Candidatus Saganbacteria bacterium]